MINVTVKCMFFNNKVTKVELKHKRPTILLLLNYLAQKETMSSIFCGCQFSDNYLLFVNGRLVSNLETELRNNDRVLITTHVMGG